MRFIIRDEMLKDRVLQHIIGLPFIQSGQRKVYSVTIEEYDPPRSLSQNAFLHAVPLRLICDATGYDIDEMKDYLLGEAFGWEEKEIMGHTSVRPLRRSGSLKRKEFSWFLEWIEAWAMSTLGLLIPRPNEELK